jgi:hypothetical protein
MCCLFYFDQPSAPGTTVGVSQRVILESQVCRKIAGPAAPAAGYGCRVRDQVLASSA